MSAQRLDVCWVPHFYAWGIPFEYMTDSEGSHCLIRRPMDARALDAVSRCLDLKHQKQNHDLLRAAFERARRDEEFLEALEAATLARLYADASVESVRNVLEAQLPFEHALAWRHHIEWEEAADKLANAARAHLIAPSRLTAQMSLRAIEEYEGCHKQLWRRFEWGSDEPKRKLFSE